MMVLFKRTLTVLSLSICIVCLIGVSCSKKSSPTSSSEDHTPAITIITPEDESELESGEDSVTLKAYIKNSDYVDSVTINGEKVSDFPPDDDTLRVKLAVENDTAAFEVIVYYEETEELDKTVSVFKATTPGMGVISGVLLQDAEPGLGKKLAQTRIAKNAQGTAIAVDEVIPISGADIMLYDANSLSTSSDTSVKTDSDGNWSVKVDTGNYFVFAVYFDHDNLEIVTTSLPDIVVEENTETETDSAIAVSDDINPMLLSFLDAAEANDDGMFIASDVPVGLPIAMSFSEAMNRTTAGDSITGIVLGEVAVDSSDLPLIDTIPVKKLWGPNSKELRLIPKTDLTVGKTYKVVIPISVKDLALNKLDMAYSGLFDVVEVEDLPAFALKATAPSNNDTIPPGFPIEFIFSRPADVLSLNRNFTISADEDTEMNGYFEVKGMIARFVPKKLWIPEDKYTITIKEDAKDLLDSTLGTEVSLSFYIEPRDSFEQKEGAEGQVATAVKKFMGAYIAGDLESFSLFFHPTFELVEKTDDGETRLQLTTFLEQMRAEIEKRNRLAKYGIIAPVFYYPKTANGITPAWKLIKDGNAVYFEDMGPDGGIGRVPRILSMDTLDVTDSVIYVDRGIVYKGDTLYFAPEMNKTFIDEDTREDDPTIFGKLLKNSTNVETQEILLALRFDFIFRNIDVNDSDNTAKVMIELIEEQEFKDGKLPFPIEDPNDPPPAIEKHITALQTKMILVAGKWKIVQIAATELYSGDKGDFKDSLITEDQFVIQEFEQTRPIELTKPPQKGISIDTPIVLEWHIENDDDIGGYVLAITNELSGGNSGLLIFTKDTTLTIHANGALSEGATILAADPKSLNVPIPPFSQRLNSFSPDDSDVYVWKVMGIKDALASAIQTGTPLNIIADSDFGPQKGLGIFTLLEEMPDITQNLTVFDQSANMGEDRFADRDNDMFANWIERAFGTNPDDPGQFPNFKMDSDQDGYADFMEKFAGTDPDDKESVPVDEDPADKIPDTLQKRPEWDPILNADSDNDGYPDEVEFIFGTDAWNAESKPSTSIKPKVPVNDYYGGIKIGENSWKRIKFSLIADTSGNFVYLDTTQLQGIARGGNDLIVDLFWENGEWIFYLGIVEGPNTGKFIKVRFHWDGNYLRGPIDLADEVNGGGPYIGEFVASLEMIEDFNTMGGGTGSIITEPDPQGEVNLGPPPSDRLVRPTEKTGDLTVLIDFPEDAPMTITAIAEAEEDTIEFRNPYWAPGRFPSLGAEGMEDDEQHHYLEGNLHRTGDAASGEDSLVLVGIVEFDEPDDMGGSFRQRVDYIVFLPVTEETDLHAPAGTWQGWYIEPEQNQNIPQGPLPFIGKKDSVDAALEHTSSKGVLIESKETVTIESTMQNEMGMWRAVSGDMEYFIMEKLGDPQSVMIQDVDGTPYIGLSASDNTGGMGENHMLFSGDSILIVEKLDVSNNEVKVNAPNPFNVTVDPETLKKETHGDGAIAWVVKDANDPQHVLIFLAPQDNDGSVLLIDGDLPLVGERIDIVPFQADDSTAIISALTDAEHKVILKGSNNTNGIIINPGSVHRIYKDGTDEFVWAVAAVGNPDDIFIFLGEMDDPTTLLLSGNMPVVVFP